MLVADCCRIKLVKQTATGAGDWLMLCHTAAGPCWASAGRQRPEFPDSTPHCISWIHYAEAFSSHSIRAPGALFRHDHGTTHKWVFLCCSSISGCNSSFCIRNSGSEIIQSVSFKKQAALFRKMHNLNLNVVADTWQHCFQRHFASNSKNWKPM